MHSSKRGSEADALDLRDALPDAMTIRSLATHFERKFLFSIGRHFWNFIAICGFIGMATGGILALNGSLELSQKEEPLKRRLKQVPEVSEVNGNFNEWFSEKCPSLGAKKGFSAIKHKKLCENFAWMTTEAQPGWDRACTSTDYEGKTYEKYDYVDGKCQGFEWKFADVWGYSSEYMGVHDEAVDKYTKKLEEKQKIESENSQVESELIALRASSGVQIGLGGVAAAWGLGVVALSALNAALLAIERNTRHSRESADWAD